MITYEQLESELKSYVDKVSAWNRVTEREIKLYQLKIEACRLQVEIYLRQHHLRQDNESQS